MGAFFKRHILRYLDVAGRHQLVTLLVVLLTVAVSATVASRLQLRSSIKELLPDKSQSVEELNRLVERMGGVGTLIVVAESPNVEANKALHG